jgi:hypothetical protein
MKEKHILFIILGLIITIISVLFYYTEEYTIKGVVNSHNVTSDKSGNSRTYSTIIICDDGYIREQTGLNYYVVPVGQVIELKRNRINFNKK